MVKNLLCFIYVALTISSFSFWKMERLYKGYSSDYTSVLLSKNKNCIPKKESDSYFPCSAMLYEENTSIFLKNIPYPVALTCRNLNLEFYLFMKRENFLLCNFNYDNNFFTEQNLKELNRDDIKCAYSYCSFINYQRLPLIFKNELAEIYPNIIDIEILENGKKVTDALNKNNGITLCKELFSSSCVKVSNLFNQVVLTKDNKIINLATALKNYFKKASPDINLNQGYIDFTKEDIETDLPSLSIFNLLNESEILAVWSLIPVKIEVLDDQGKKTWKIIESQMIGLARDKEGKLFHWTTDLRNDISVLMGYAPDISNTLPIFNEYLNFSRPDI